MNTKSKKSKKRFKIKKQTPKKIFPTDNAKKINDFMESKRVKGKYKDYVLITGSRLIDWLDSYEIAIEDEEGMKSYGVDGIALVHKSKLKKLIGEEASAKFWKMGMRTNLGIERRRIGCAKSSNKC